MNYKQITKVVYDTELSIMDYLILLNVYYKSEEEFLKDERFRGHFAYLQQLGYLGLNNKLTLEGKNLIEFEIGIPSYEAKVTTDFYVELHKKLQDRLVELTGKKQNMLQGKYQFLPGCKDLQTILAPILKKYTLKDLNRVEKILLKHINTSVKARFDKTQTIQYFITKNNVSALATAYDNYEDVEEDTKITTTESGVHLI